jgi:UDP-glucose 4-epimerase
VDRFLVTGSSGHLGEALVRTLRDQGHDVVGLDILDAETTTVVGSITDQDTVGRAMAGARYVLHTATLHKPHVGSHGPQDFVDTNITGTLTVLGEAVAAGVESMVFTSSTSTFGRALTPAPGAPAAWITEDVRPVVKNIYGATKIAAEDLCELAHREDGLSILILRTSRFFPEGDDRDDVRAAYPDLNVKVNELLYRRVDIADVVSAHVLAATRGAGLGFGRYVITATTPFTQDDLAELATNAPAVVARLFPDQPDVYRQAGWQMFPTIERVYVNTRARTDLGWTPRHDFATALEHVRLGQDPRSALATTIGAKGYHEVPTGPYTT